MLMLILAEAGLRPSFVIGGDVTDMGTGAQWTGGEWFVVEADESDGTHLELPLHGTILTNVETDHLDHYGSFEASSPGSTVTSVRSPVPRSCAATTPSPPDSRREHGAITYGTSEGCRRTARSTCTPSHGTLTFADRTGGRASRRRRLAVARASQRAQRGRGVGDGGRDRCRLRRWLRTRSPSSAASPAGSTSAARIGGATFVDDYAHLPSEIAAVLDAARHSDDGWRRVVAVFQPNRYNRMAEISADYGDSFGDADLVVLTDIYPSGTQPIPGVTGKLVVNAVLDARPVRRASRGCPSATTW